MSLPRILPWLAAILLPVLPLRAHRMEGLLQSSLVEVFPDRVEVEVTLLSGIDVAPQVIGLVDIDVDGALQTIELESWAGGFLRTQQLRLDGVPQRMKVRSVRSSLPSTWREGHGELVVQLVADLGERMRGDHTLEIENGYDEMPATFQCHGLVPKSPGVQIRSHRRGAKERTLILEASVLAPPAAPTAGRAGWSLATGLVMLGLLAPLRRVFLPRPTSGHSQPRG